MGRIGWVVERVPPWLSVAIALTSAAGAWSLAVLAPQAHGDRQVQLTGLGMVLAAVAVGLPLLERWRALRRANSAQELAAEAEARVRLAIGDTLDPLANALGAIVCSTRSERAAARGQVKALVLGAAVNLVSAKQRARASFYRIDGGNHGRRRLICEGFQGRSGSPRKSFDEEQEIGRLVFAMLDRHQGRFVPDNSAELGPDVRKSYGTYIAVSVAVGNEVMGMLCVDAPSPGDLDEDHDLPLMRMLAGFLGVALRV